MRSHHLALLLLSPFLTHPGDGSQRLFVVAKPGRIRIIRNEFDRTARIDKTGEIIVTLLRTKVGLQFSGLPLARN